jgi:acetolactate synthase I/II/III large subunit
MGRPDKTCVALVGDGAFMMHGAEVSTAQAHGVGAIWVVLDDGDLHMVSQGMQYLYPTPDDIWNDLYRLGKPDLVKFAEGLGADAYRIDSPAALEAIMPTVLDMANNQGRPQVIVAAINQQSIDPYFPPKPSTPEPVWGGGTL